ncbi:hypothetical protein FRUB_07660 [Fimbriiglobus ruber]|uniref:Bulb-type lectin domain-containing protein n=2 Tax=Fimbriiglobus ruber TaxID=1908690 RepID=A0A225DAC5_9BACT|nr:hypothetical protein FRUB_07660 [Fimbriiglobus ruber]
MAMLWLETDDLATIAERIVRSGACVVEPSDGQSMIITDPDGIVIEIWQTEEAGDG